MVEVAITKHIRRTVCLEKYGYPTLVHGGNSELRFFAETDGAVTLVTAAPLGILVFTTHTIAGAIVGVGSTRRASAVRSGVAGNIVCELGF